MAMQDDIIRNDGGEESEIRDSGPKLPARLEECAFLLDVDGTLLDLAATPREVFVPVELRRSLARLREMTHGAVAFVSGRLIEELDLIFAPLNLAAIGGHGAEFRLAADGDIQTDLVVPLPAKIKQRFAVIAEEGPGIIVEDKNYSLALHYRLAPDKEEYVRRAAARVCDEIGSDNLELLPGKFVVEIKQTGFNKATAVRALMAHKPFAGRKPVFIGDDTTDEPVFPVIPDFGGEGFSVGRRIPGVRGHFDKPADVRRWLETLAVGTTP
jgi:trehalose 6-phosphate phosphatase